MILSLWSTLTAHLLTDLFISHCHLHREYLIIPINEFLAEVVYIQNTKLDEWQGVATAMCPVLPSVMAIKSEIKGSSTLASVNQRIKIEFRPKILRSKWKFHTAMCRPIQHRVIAYMYRTFANEGPLRNVRPPPTLGSVSC